MLDQVNTPFTPEFRTAAGASAFRVYRPCLSTVNRDGRGLKPRHP